MLVENAKKLIEDYADLVVRENPFFIKLARKEVSQESLHTYVFSIRYLLYHTPVFLKYAAQVSQEKGMHELADYFLDKIVEEDGHYLWAENDLKSLGAQNGGELDTRVAASIKNLLGYLKSEIKTNPKLYLSYILFAEYITVLLSPYILDHLDNGYQIKRDQMSAIANHEELDKEHIKDDFEIINRFVKREDGLDSAFLNVIDNSFNHTDGFFKELVS